MGPVPTNMNTTLRFIFSTMGACTTEVHWTLGCSVGRDCWSSLASFKITTHLRRSEACWVRHIQEPLSMTYVTFSSVPAFNENNETIKWYCRPERQDRGCGCCWSQLFWWQSPSRSQECTSEKRRCQAYSRRRRFACLSQTKHATTKCPHTTVPVIV